MELPEYKDIKTSKDNLHPEKDIYHKTLCRLIQTQNSNEAKEMLIKSCSGYVIKIATKLWTSYGSSTEMDDLIQEGYIGLLEAAERFDTTVETSFLTYATFWIKQKTSRAISEGYMVHIPINVQTTLHQIIKLDNKYSQYPPSERKKMIGKELNIPEKTLSFYYLTIKRFFQLKSIDKMLYSDNPQELIGGDIIHIINGLKPINVEDEVMKSCLSEDVRKVLNLLTEKEKEVVTLRYGLDDGVEKTLEQIGIEKGVTRERIRQIEAKGLRKLRINKKKLYDYCYE